MVGKGRKKVEIELIKEASSRMVCFSKRRKGLFKKAEELSVLTGSKTAVLAFSQAGKLFCSDAQTLDSLLCSHGDVPSAEKESEGLQESSFADASINADSFCRQFAGTEVEEAPREYAYTEAMAADFDPSFDMPDLDLSLIEAMIDELDSFTHKEAEICWQFDFNEAMDGKNQHFWFNRPNVQKMSSEELRQLESAILGYQQLQIAQHYHI